MESMRAIGDQMREAEAMGEDKPIDSLFKDFDERTGRTRQTATAPSTARRTATATRTETGTARSRRTRSWRPAAAGSGSPRTRAT
jgi:hypothetical protein